MPSCPQAALDERGSRLAATFADDGMEADPASWLPTGKPTGPDSCVIPRQRSNQPNEHQQTQISTAYVPQKPKWPRSQMEMTTRGEPVSKRIRQQETEHLIARVLTSWFGPGQAAALHGERSPLPRSFCSRSRQPYLFVTFAA